MFWFILFFISVLSIVVSLLLYLLSFLSSFKLKNKNKMSVFESGFSGMGLMQTSFSVHFFIILIMFVIFDCEIILLLGCLFSINLSSFFFIIFFVLGGVYLEWYLGKLKWMV